MQSLKAGDSVSCGCSRLTPSSRAACAVAAFRHGQTGSSVHQTWRSMLQRCLDPNVAKFKRYGGRGIKVCERWLTFENFYADMGERPAGHSIDRIDNDGNYEPGNCRWATQKEQANNQSSNRVIEYGGRSRTMSQWADEVGLKVQTLHKRLLSGWTTEAALTTPVV